MVTVAKPVAEAKHSLLRFWVCASADVVRIEYLTPAGTVEQSVCHVGEPCGETEGRPSVSFECPDDIAERVAELAYEVIDNGASSDSRFAGWDPSRAAAWDAMDAFFSEAA